MRIGIKILNFVLATILLTSAALHQEKADVFEFDLVLGVQTEEVGPGDYVECSPVVTNIGNIPGNVYLKIIQPMVQEEGTPLYVFEINDKWMKKEELVLGDEVVITYMAFGECSSVFIPVNGSWCHSEFCTEIFYGNF